MAVNKRNSRGLGDRNELLNTTLLRRSKAMSDSKSTVPAGFRQIPGYPRYAINAHATILSICGPAMAKDRQWIDARQAKQTVDKGYSFVCLYDMGRKRRKWRVHILVLTTFVGPCPDGMVCRHLDGNPSNNHVSNLAWGTPLENSADRITHGTDYRGERVGSSKLKASDAIEIRRRRANGEFLHVLAAEFGVSKYAIYSIAKRLTWNHV